MSGKTCGTCGHCARRHMEAAGASATLDRVCLASGRAVGTYWRGCPRHAERTDSVEQVARDWAEWCLEADCDPVAFTDRLHVLGVIA